MYKENCGFRRVNVCTFKAEDCSPANCDMYNVEFTVEGIKAELRRLKDEIDKLTVECLDMSKIKIMCKTEDKDKNNPDVVAFKKKLLHLKDLGKGYEYMNKAYIFVKRANLVRRA